MTDREGDIDAVKAAQEIISSEDNREILVEISPGAYLKITPWFLERNDQREQIFTNQYYEDAISRDAYQEHLHAGLATKLLKALRQPLSDSGKVRLNISYREIDALVLSSFSFYSETSELDLEFRDGMRNGDFGKSIAFHARDLKESLLELIESFVASGGYDRFGHLETLRRVRGMKVISFLDDDESAYLIEVKDEDGNS